MSPLKVSNAYLQELLFMRAHLDYLVRTGKCTRDQADRVLRDVGEGLRNPSRALIRLTPHGSEPWDPAAGDAS